MTYTLTAMLPDGTEVSAVLEKDGRVPITDGKGGHFGDFELTGRKLRIRNGHLQNRITPYLRLEGVAVKEVGWEDDLVMLADGCDEVITLRTPTRLRVPKMTGLYSYIMASGLKLEGSMNSVTSLGPNPDAQKDPGQTGSARQDSIAPPMIRAMFLAEPTAEQMSECDRWVKDQGDRGYHFYDDNGRWRWKDAPSEKVRLGAYRAPTRFTPEGTYDRTQATEGLWVEDYMHMTAPKLACVGCFANDPVAIEYLFDQIEAVCSQISYGWTAPRGFGYVAQAIAYAVLASGPYYPTDYLYGYAERLLDVLESHNGEFQGRLFNALDDGTRHDHIGVSEWMEQMSAIHGVPDPKVYAKSQPVWMTGILIYGLDALIEAFPGTSIAARCRAQLKIAADVLVQAISPGFHWKTGEFRLPSGLGIANDVAPEARLIEDAAPSFPVGTGLRFLLPGIVRLHLRYQMIPIGLAVRIIEEANARHYWGGDTPLEVNLGSTWELSGILGEPAAR